MRVSKASSSAPVTLRRFGGDDFDRTKTWEWNALFRDDDGRRVRALVTERLTAFCRSHRLDYEADPRSNRERGLPSAEPQLPKWNFEREKRTGERAATLIDLEAHRQRRRAWRATRAEAKVAEAEVIALARERRRRSGERSKSGGDEPP